MVKVYAKFLVTRETYRSFPKIICSGIVQFLSKNFNYITSIEEKIVGAKFVIDKGYNFEDLSLTQPLVLAFQECSMVQQSKSTKACGSD